jgi:ATP-dependent DNA ligase
MSSVSMSLLTARTFYNEGASYRRSSKSDNLVKVGRFIVGHGIELFRLAKEKGLEGIIAKRAASTYQPRRRSPDRLKINARLKKKFVIGDITEGKESRKQIGALLLGVYELAPWKVTVFFSVLN